MKKMNKEIYYAFYLNRKILKKKNKNISKILISKFSMNTIHVNPGQKGSIRREWAKADQVAVPRERRGVAAARQGREPCEI